MKTNPRKKAKSRREFPRCVPRQCQSLLTGVFYAELLPGHRVRLVYTNGYKISAVIDENLIKTANFLAIVDTVETIYATRKLHKKLTDITDRLQILEMEKGYDYMLGSKLNQKYKEILPHYEILAGKPFHYQRNI